MKVAVVYDRANSWGGAERVLISLSKIFTNAQLFTSLVSHPHPFWTTNYPNIYVHSIGKIPYLRNKHRYLGTLMPYIFESFDFSSFDLVISVTSEAAKGIITGPNTKHVCYCLTPTRYLWSHHDLYFRNRILRYLSRPAVSYLRRWDSMASCRPDLMIAISSTVQKRIKKYYDRDSVVVHPPLSLKLEVRSRKSDVSAPGGRKQISDYFLIVSRLVPYKRVDVAITAFNDLGLPLVIVGTGGEEHKLRKMSAANISFVSNLGDLELAEYYTHARALIFPQEEDFGLVAVEAMHYGTPVIAFKRGGALDIVSDPKNGIFFDAQNAGSLKRAVNRFLSLEFDGNIITASVKKFSEENFKDGFLKAIGV